MTVQTRGAELIGRTLGGRYRLLALIGTGASAGVYLAEDTSLRRRVAVKVLHPGLAHDASFQRRFRAEARAAAALSHPHVLAVHDWGESDGDYLVTELLEGGSLRDLLATGARLSLSQALLVGLHTAQGLAYAHRRGFVHRDIKPGNLLFDRDGRLRIADFGIARAVAEAAWTEPEGVLVGTARYAAPEQASAGPIDGRADVYSLALTVVEAVTGGVPLVGETPLATMVLRQSTPMPIPEDLGPLVEPLRRAGSHRPEDRSTAEELAAALLTAAAHLARPAPLPLAGLTTTGPEALSEEPAAAIPPTDRGDEGDPAAPAGPALGEAAVGSTGTAATPGPSRSDDGVDPVAPRTGADPTAAPTAPGPAAGADRPAAPAPAPVDPDATVVGLPLTPAADAAPSGAAAGAQPATSHAPPEEASTSPAVEEAGADDEPPAGDGSRRRRRWPWVALLLLLVAGVAGGTWQYLRTRTPTYDVGSYVGVPVSEVRAEAADNDWILVEAVERRDGSTAGEVLEQAPEAGTSLEEGDTLSVLVSEGQLLRDVPALAGAALADAEAALAAAQLQVGATSSEHHEEVPAGHVISAGAAEGTQLETDSAVDLVLSDGPAPRTIPAVVGSSRADAVAAIEGLGLAPSIVEEYSQQVPEGTVISVSPAPGEQVERGATVEVVISLGRPFVVVPDVVGLSAAEASDQLEAAGFVVVDTVGPPNRPVLVTDPPAGESRRQGERITIVTRAS